MNKRRFVSGWLTGGCVLILSVFLSGCSLLTRSNNKPVSGEDGFEVKNIMSNPIYDENGQVDQEAFEAQQTVEPVNDDLNTIEADLESTVILEEDFSNL